MHAYFHPAPLSFLAYIFPISPIPMMPIVVVSIVSMYLIICDMKYKIQRLTVQESVTEKYIYERQPFVVILK